MLAGKDCKNKATFLQMCYLSSIEGVYYFLGGAGDEKHLIFEDYTVQNTLLLSVYVLFLTRLCIVSSLKRNQVFFTMAQTMSTNELINN